MNKTLLLVICDFLLLNLLALTRWEKPPESKPVNAQPAQTVQQVVQEDLVGALRTTLEDERRARDEVDEQLRAASTALTQRDESLAEREQRLAAARAELEKKAAEARQLGERVADSQATVSQLSDRLTQSAQQAATARTQAEQLARELAEKQAAAERLAQQVSQLEQDRAQAQQQIQSLSTQVQVADKERTLLRENVDTLRTQVGAEREEKVRLQEQTGKLAEGVTQLAENSAGLRKEIRANTPINANTLFNDFLANRISATFRWQRDTFLGPSTRSADTKTILVTDGTEVYALFHADNTPANLGDTPADWREIEGRLVAGSRPVAVDRLRFLATDARVVVLPVDAATAAALGVRIHPTAAEPFKFPEAVIISQDGRYYGEVEFKLDAQTPGYVRMKTRIFSSLFGEFSPSKGDLVFSKTGEILGVMANNEYCVLLDNFSGSGELPFGASLADRKTSAILTAQRSRIARLPLKLQ